MSDHTPGQQSLTSYNSQNSSVNGATSTAPSTIDSTQASQSSSPSSSSPSPFNDLYEIINEHAATLIPEDISRQLKPTNDLYTTKNIPDNLPALPFEVGQWELVERGKNRLFYMTRGDAYDEQWGDGGSVYGIEVYHNTSGYNKDNKYHRRATTRVGFDNADQVKHTEIDSRDEMYGIRGFNPGTNAGDYGYSSGSQMKSETIEDAAIELLIYLHYHQQPFGSVVPTSPDNHWQLQKLDPRKATWTSDAPSQPGESIRLSLHENRLSLLKGKDEGAGTPDYTIDLSDLNITYRTELADTEAARFKFPTIETAVKTATEIISTGLVPDQ